MGGVSEVSGGVACAMRVFGKASIVHLRRIAWHYLLVRIFWPPNSLRVSNYQRFYAALEVISLSFGFRSAPRRTMLLHS